MNSLWITTHKGKMQGIDSISTSCMLNPYCQSRQLIEGAVCQKCYSMKYLSYRPSLREKVAINTDLLSEQLLEDSKIPFINSHTFRLESFGDLVNEIHLKNYIKICKLNPRTTFGLWTKNLVILDKVFKEIAKPDNLIINLSSPYLNKQFEGLELVDYIDHVFTVYTKQYAQDNGIVINCGAKHCIKCLICYTKGGDFYINELLK